jgi:hypothetical protein
MDQILGLVNAIKPKFDDDSVDRLNYYYSTVVLLAFAVTLSAKQYVGQAIQCFVPAEFTGSWEAYTENYCYVENTYWLPMNESIPDGVPSREARQITYYQWVPFVLTLQALLFHLPRLVWRLLNWQSGLCVKQLVAMACDAQNIDNEVRAKSVQTIARHIEDASAVQKHRGKLMNPMMWLLVCGKPKGLFVTSLYIFVKGLYILNIFAQFAIVNAFIDAKYTLWGVEILKDILRDKSWEQSGHFPRVTMCDFEVRHLGTTRRYSVQCVLMVNMFNEKIYLFLWWWFVLVAVLTLLNAVWWIYVSLLRHNRIRFVDRYIRTIESIRSDTRRPVRTQTVAKFTRSRLRPDGVFVLRLISGNAGDVVATDVLAELWRRFLADHHTEMQLPAEPMTVGNTEF